MTRRALNTIGGATVLSTALATGWTAVAVAAVVVAVVLAIALCWVVADADRPDRLALLLTAWRDGTPAPHHTRKPRPPAADRTIAAE